MPMNRTRIIIAAARVEVKNALRQLLARGGYQLLAEAADGIEALRSARCTSPDLVLAEADLPGINGFELGRALTEDRLAPVLLISQEVFFLSKFEVEKAQTIKPPIGYVTKPLSELNLFPAIESVLSFHRYLGYLEKEIRDLHNKIESRKVIEQAKGILMEQMGLSEAEAYRRIQKQSMDKCLSMKKVAEAIILTNDLKK